MNLIFTSTTTHTVTQYLQNVRVFMIGGGSSGAGSFLGGGGAGYITTATYSSNLSPGHIISVTIGAGGDSVVAGSQQTNAGGNTTVNIAGTSYTALGGGDGAFGIDARAGRSGSSGGGGGGNPGYGGLGGADGSDGTNGTPLPGYEGGKGMGSVAFTAAINFMSGYNIYNIRAGTGGFYSSFYHSNTGGGGGAGVITGSTNYPLAYPTAEGGVIPATGYGAGGGSGGWWQSQNYFGPGGAGAPGMAYVFADVIPPAAPTITFNNMTTTYGDGAFGISAPSSNSGGSFSYQVTSGGSVSISGTTVTINVTGTTYVQASQGASGNFLTGVANGTITVNKATPSLTVSKNKFITKYILNGAIDFNVLSTNAESGYTRAFSFTSGGIITIPNSAYPTASITGPGTTTVNVTQSGTTNYNAVTVNNIITFVIIGQGGTYSSENMVSLDLSGNNLSSTVFNSCDLTGANLYNATINSSTNLSSSTLTSIKSGRITGFTTLLPANYKII